MKPIAEIWVKRSNLREAKIVVSKAQELTDREVRVEIDRAALTSNNVSYAVTGDKIGYWNFYPVDDDWGQVPVWGMASVIESMCSEVAVGQRFWGFYPIASHTILKVGHVKGDTFVEDSAHRRGLPALYNQYRCTDNEPEFMKALEDERCLFVPQFVTGYVIYDYLVQNNFFNADQVLIGSVSSKTGLGLAQLIHQSPKGAKAKVVGLTSPANVKFVQSLGCCDQIVVYGQESGLSNERSKAVYVDMAGNKALTTSIHNAFGERLVESVSVGATHWESIGGIKESDTSLPGATPKFFFTPAHIDAREKQLGRGVIQSNAMKASVQLIRKVVDQVTIERVVGAAAVIRVWVDMLDNKVPARRGIIISLLPKPSAL